LSPREFEVLRLLVQGGSLHDFAVANHQSLIRQKLGVDPAVKPLQAAARLGIVPAGAAP
jgi:hypothetical protein